MPYSISKHGSKFSVINLSTGHVFSKNSTKKNATKQLALLNSLHGGGTSLKKAMSDGDLHEYFPNAKIFKISEIPQTADLSAFAPHGVPIYLLYEHDLNAGHWCAMTRTGDKEISYFDSFGNVPGFPVSWNSDEQNAELNQGSQLTDMLDRSPEFTVKYNDYDYQADDSATCGRFATSFLKHVIKHGGTLASFKSEMMKQQKLNHKKTADALIVDVIPG